MNNTVIAAGMVVKSMAGHDSGSYYAVMRVENGFAYVFPENRICRRQAAQGRKTQKEESASFTEDTDYCRSCGNHKQKTKICVIGSEPKCRQHRRGE